MVYVKDLSGTVIPLDLSDCLEIRQAIETRPGYRAKLFRGDEELKEIEKVFDEEVVNIVYVPIELTCRIIGDGRHMVLIKHENGLGWWCCSSCNKFIIEILEGERETHRLVFYHLVYEDQDKFIPLSSVKDIEMNVTPPEERKKNDWLRVFDDNEIVHLLDDPIFFDEFDLLIDHIILVDRVLDYDSSIQENLLNKIKEEWVNRRKK